MIYMENDIHPTTEWDAIKKNINKQVCVYSIDFYGSPTSEMNHYNCR